MLIGVVTTNQSGILPILIKLQKYNLLLSSP